MKSATLLRAALASSVLALIPATTAGLAAVDARSGPQFSRLITVYQLVKAQYVEQVDDTKLVNGAIDTTLRVPSAARAEGGFHTSIATIVSLRQSGWVAVRVFEANASGRVRFAHSSPLFVDLPGRPLLPRREEIDYLVQRVRGEIARSADVLSPAALGEFREALAFYERLAAQVP